MKASEQCEARRLRRLGHSIKEICELLKVAKSSVSLWVRDIALSPEQIHRLDQRMLENRQRFTYLSQCGGANTNKADAEARHQAFQQAGYERAKKDERFRLICALYWGEGTKSGGVFSVANCDPTMLRVILTWLFESGFDKRIRFAVQYYEENGLSEETIRNWWLERLPNLRLEHCSRFTRCTINRASQRKKIGKQPYGTGRIRVCSTELFHNVLGAINYLREMGDW